MLSATVSVLFDDHDPEAGEQQWSSVVQPAQQSLAAHAKATSKRTADDLPVQSSRSLIKGVGDADGEDGEGQHDVHDADAAGRAPEAMLRVIAGYTSGVARTK